MDNKRIVGVDIGGSHITVALVDLSSLEILPESLVRMRIDSSAPAEEIIQNWAKAIRTACEIQPGKDAYLGIAMPGPFDYKNGISLVKDQGKYDSLYKLNIKQLLSKELAIPADHIRFSNDAGCFLQGEIHKSELEKYERAVGLTLGTGMGSAYMVEKNAYDANLWETPYLGGIIEDYISSRWFVNEFKKRTSQDIQDVRDLVENYQEHETTQELFFEFSSNLAQFLYKFISRRDANVVILGGNIAKAHSFFVREVRKQLYDLMGFSIPVCISTLGENAALIGAASQFYHKKSPSKVTIN